VDKYDAGNYDIAVIGGGHAGCEAALASARLGMKTILFTISLDNIANMPCNPSIGGTAKGHLVREIDALGGEMGRAADACTIQSRMLNRGKGPAVHSLRVQIDRSAYHQRMKRTLEEQENLWLRQAEVVSIGIDAKGRVNQVCTHLGAAYTVRAAILCSGTYLKSTIFVGDSTLQSGPDGNLPANQLSGCLAQLGITLRRFKTGTPARVHSRSIAYSQLEAQKGDEKIQPFSFDTQAAPENLVECYISYTNDQTHEIIRKNLHRSPLYGGKIEGVGPRYCPSIEDKVVRFADKERHQLFIEPMGLDTKEMYLQGMSSSLPEDVQAAFYRSIKGLERVEVMRSAYAIEYDCCDPTELASTLEFKNIPGLYGAGQFNGTSGYEEAAAQGLIAGINATRYIKGQPPFILGRDTSYIGTLIDDLVVKGCNEPYRMMTSRSEYRLLLRQDNADLRLTSLGYEVGLVSEGRYKRLLEKRCQIEGELLRVEKAVVSPTEEVNKLLCDKGTAPIRTGVKLADLIKRPQLSYADLSPFDKDAPQLPDEVREQVEIGLKYEGYIKRQQAQVEQMRRLENRLLPSGVRYQDIHGLRLEAREKLSRQRPVNLGQASRISGISPADIAVLMIYLEQYKKGEGVDTDGAGEL